MLLRNSLSKRMQLPAFRSSLARQPNLTQLCHSLPAKPSHPRPLSAEFPNKPGVSANALVKELQHTSQWSGATAMAHSPAASSLADAQPSATNLQPEAASQPVHDTQCLVIEPLSFLWCAQSLPSCVASSPALPVPKGTTIQEPAVSSATSAIPSTVPIPTHTHDSFYHAAVRDSSTDASPDMTALRCAVTLLTAGQAVAIPTETVYGLAANALSAEAVAKIFQAKQRPSDNPLIIHVSSMEMLQGLYPPGWQLPDVYTQVVAELWPGPLTILLPCSPLIPSLVTCGHPTMAVRMPAHPVARALIAACGFPLAAPSANSSGRPSPTLASHVMEDLRGRIPLVLDGGPCGCGVESTVLDGLRQPPVLLRPGGVTYERLSKVPGLERLQVYRRDFVDAALEAAPTTPGMKYRHYSPNAQVILIDPQAWQSRLLKGRKSALQQEQQITTAPTSLPSDSTSRTSTQPQLTSALEWACLREEMQASLGVLLRELRLSGVGCVGVLRSSLPDGSVPPGLIIQAGLGASRLSDGCGDAGMGGELAGNDDDVQGGWVVQEYMLGGVEEPGKVAQELFRGLRCLDQLGCEVIVVEGVCDVDEGLAVMNRLRKAASRCVELDGQ